MREINYFEKEYKELKKQIDELDRRVSTPVELEKGKAEILSNFAPYTNYLQKVTQKTIEEICEYILELGGDTHFFDSLSTLFGSIGFENPI